MPPKKMLLIFNPVAGRGEFVLNLFDIIDRFVKSGFEVTLYPTARSRDAYDIAMRRAADFDYLVCSGGDGTLNEAVDALMQMERRPLLGYIPSGTTNDFATSHNLPTDVFLGANAVMEGDSTAIDVGRLQDEYFTYVAAFGLFTDVSYGTPQSMKNMLGQAAYILEGVKKLAGVKLTRCAIRCDGELIEGEFVLGMIINSYSVGGFKLPEHLDIRLDDGRFEMILLRSPQSLQELSEAVATLLGKGELSPAFIVRSGKSFEIECSEPLAWAIDGEYGGAFESTSIQVFPRAIQIITP